MTPALLARLPRNPTDGQQVADEAGNIYVYRAKDNTWIEHGTTIVSPGVTESRDGLVTPDVFRRLSLVRTATNGGKSLPTELKILPHTDVYWYLFTSSDKMIKFIPEGPSRLRLEFDVSRFYAYLATRSCRGPKGPTGDPGNPGQDATLGGPEQCATGVTVSPDGTRLDLKVTVPAPLTTNISLRVARSAGAAASPGLTILFPPDGNMAKATVTVADATIKFDQTRTLRSLVYNPDTQVLTGSLFTTTVPWPYTCVLAHQQGPVGDPGQDGTGMLTPKACQAGTDQVRFTKPIISIRPACNGTQLLTQTADLFENVCVSQLSIDTVSPGAGTLATATADKGRFLGVKMTLDACKDIVEYKPNLPSVTVPDLELPEWTPQGDCTLNKRAEYSDFNWVPRTDQGNTWQAPDGVRSSEYPWLILIPPKPPAGACDPCAPKFVTPPCPT